MTVRLFDRYAKLRDAIRLGRITTQQKEILGLLTGRLGKEDVPAVLVEPAGHAELRAVMEFAAEKHLKIAVAAGLSPVDVRDLDGQILLFTTRLAGAPMISTSRQSARVDAGSPIETLLVDFNRAGLRWLPLFPVPLGATPGELVASGWEGLRNWRDGGFLSQVDAVEWMGYDGKLHRTGVSALSDSGPDVSAFLYGSRGALGIITALELRLQPLPQSRTAMLYELSGTAEAVELLALLRESAVQPDAVVYYGPVTTEIVRRGNDQTVSDQARVLVAVEWPDSVRGPEPDFAVARVYDSQAAVDALWQDLFRLPRTTSRLYPQRTAARLRLPASAIKELEEAARDLGHDANLAVALWGNVEAGHFHVWILQPDDQPRTQRTADDLLRRILEVAINLGGSVAPGSTLPAAGSRNGLAERLREQLLQRCDPQHLNVPLRK